MEISLIKIGDSFGIKLDDSLLKKYNLRDVVELEMMEDHIVLKSPKKPRQNWEKAFQEMRENGDDKLLIADIFKDEKL